MTDQRQRRFAAAMLGMGLAYFALVRWLPSAATPGRARSANTPTIVGGLTLYSIAMVTAARSDMLKFRKYSEGYLLSLVLAFCLWVMVQPLFLDAQFANLARSVSIVILMLSGIVVARYLTAEDSRAEEVFRVVAQWLAITYAAAILLALANPSAVWWGYGILGGNQSRSFFYWLRQPQPIFVASILLIALQSIRGRWRPIMYITLAAMVMLVLMTRTRIYIVSLLVLLLLVFGRKFPARTLCVAATSGLLVGFRPELLQAAGDHTRFSAFASGRDPVSGRIDPTNFRGDLWRELAVMITPTGTGAEQVRQQIDGLEATSEVGVLMLFASYGFPVLLFVFFLAGGWIMALRRWLGSRDIDTQSVVSSTVLVIVPLGAVEWFGSATSVSDWLGTMFVAMAILSPIMCSESGAPALTASRACRTPRSYFDRSVIHEARKSQISLVVRAH